MKRTWVIFQNASHRWISLMGINAVGNASPSADIVFESREELDAFAIELHRAGEDVFGGRR